MIQAVNKHQGLLRASIASPGQDHRLGANEAPPAIISIFLGAELEKVFGAIERGETGETSPRRCSGWGRRCCRPYPMHGGDRNRTSPFAFTGNKFEFRALGSSMSLSLPNTVLNTIVAEAIDDLAGQLEATLTGRHPLAEALPPILQKSYAANKQVVFGGDNYSEEWHAEAEQRGLLNLRATPDALPYLVTEQTIGALLRLRRPLSARARVALRGVPRAVRDEAQHRVRDGRGDRQDAAGTGGGAPPGDAAGGAADRSGRAHVGADRRVDRRDHGARDGQPGGQPAPGDVLEHAEYMRDSVVPAMGAVREAADKLEKVVADDLWPLPKYSEILFIK